MDYSKSLIKILLISLAFTFLTACSGASDSSEPQIIAVELSSEPLSIIGFPQNKLYYDSAFSYTFGVTGGTGVYELQYLRNSSDFESNAALSGENTIAMTLHDISQDESKSAFKLEGVPVLPEGTDLTELTSSNFQYALKVTDGINVEERIFDFTLGTNRLYVGANLTFKEGTSNLSTYTSLLSRRLSGDTAVCEQVTDMPIGEREINGVDVDPTAVYVYLDAPVATTTKVYYEFSSNYSESGSERSASNVGKARPGVDFIEPLEEEGVIIFKPGEAICSVVVNIPDDDLIEGDEVFSLNFTKYEGGILDVTSASINIDLSDDEDEPKIEPFSGIANEGDIYTLPISFGKVLSFDQSVNFSIDVGETTADTADYVMLPETGVVSIPGGTQANSLSIAIERDVDDNDLLFEDETLVLTTDLDVILDLDPIELTINDWQDNLLVASEADFEEALAMVVDSHGVVTTLIEDTQSGRSKTKFRSFYRTGKPVPLSDSFDNVFEHDSIDVIPVGMKAHSISGIRYLSVVLQVDGLYGEVHRGGSDFAVAILKAEGNDSYTLHSLEQYGSEGNDVVNGVKADGEFVYIYGSTDGLALEGVGLSNSNRGGQDGFLYKIDISTKAVTWRRFIGTSGDEGIVSISVGNRDIVALLETQDSMSDGILHVMSTGTGDDREGVDGEKIASLQDDQMVAVNYDGNSSGYHAVFNSEGSITNSSGRTESLSTDVHLTSYDSESILSTTTSIATPEFDSASDFEPIADGEFMVVGGHTEGVFSDSEQYGESDAFVAVLFSGDTSRLSVKAITQFGSAEDDEVIDIEEFSDLKFFALWSEMQTTPGKRTYRISPFSIDGRMLSPELGSE